MRWKHDLESPANEATLQMYQEIMSQRSAFQPTKPTQILLFGLSFPSNPQACARHTRTKIMWVLNNLLELFIPPACSTMALRWWKQESESYSSPPLHLFFTLVLSPKPSPFCVSLLPSLFQSNARRRVSQSAENARGHVGGQTLHRRKIYRASLSWSPLRDLVAVKEDFYELWRGI